jgi:pimeloyl-ACP methyl ester carboxylesterase
MTERVTADWIIPGADGEAIRGTSHAPTGGDCRATVLLAHGFKGYKDYGFIPIFARALVERLPVTVHRFNFSHSGIGDDPSTFQRVDLFEKDTWDRQVEDLGYVCEAATRGDLPETAPNTPVVLVGHSRGGVSCILAAGRRQRIVEPVAIATLAAPDTCCSYDERTRAALLEKGRLVSPSSRTGQDLVIGSEWLMSQVVSPKGHDVHACARNLRCPLLAIHGEADVTVPFDSASHLAEEARDGRVAIIDGGDHVFNTKNPADPTAQRSEQLERVIGAVADFIQATAFSGAAEQD